MKNIMFFTSLIFISVIMSATVTSAAQITKIGTGHDPAIYGNMVTWSDNAGSIHVYDLMTQKDTTINSSSSSHPAIYGNKIVWKDNSSGTLRLTVYDLSSGVRSYITQNIDSMSIPKIYGNRIVWSSYNNTFSSNVYLFDISTSAQTRIAVGSSPDIYDTKVVYSADGREINDIFMYDITTKKVDLISPESSDLNRPHIYGNKVIWTNSRTRMGFIQMYDLATKKAIDVTSDNTANTIIPEGYIYADAGDDTGTHNAIYGDKIVYAKTGDDQFGNVGVYIYNISTGQSTPVINYPVMVQTTPEIYNNTVVWGFENPFWTDNAGDEIYVCNPATSATTQPPVANFTSNITSGTVPVSVAFTDTSNVTPTSWLWDFGDGTNSTKQNPTHVYSAEGHYVVNLTVSEYNNTYSKYATIIVFKKMNIVANFSASVNKGYAPLSVQFTDLSENAQFWSWDFGDNTFDSTSATQQNPMHTYLTPGNYTVTLSASNYSGSDYKSATITVLDQPVSTLPIADFNANITNGSAPLTVLFTDASQNATGWKWDFGDGYTSYEQSPMHIYSSEGTYNANLKVSNANGTDSSNVTITVQSSSDVGSRGDEGSNGGGSSGGSSSGGSGGGAGGSPEPQSNVEIKELSQNFVSSGQNAKFEFLQKATPVLYISFDSKKTAGKTTTTVEMLKNKSALTSETPIGEVYKYLNIWVGSSGFGTSKNIKNSVVCFKVEKSWIQDKNIDQSSITLNIYSEKKWDQLLTNLSGEDDKYLYFIAQTPGFSYFAITGKSTASRPVQPAYGDKVQNTTMSETQNNINNGSTAPSIKNTSEQKESPSQSQKSPGFELAVGIAGLLAVSLYRRN